jgi:LmbE family N-acetylglucosaminyl deacetylase
MLIAAHPDDAEFMAAGTVAKWTAGGCDVSYVVITKGDKGSDDPEMTSSRLTEIREAEQRSAAELLGVKRCIFLGYPDGYLQHTLDLRRDLTRVIRQHRPEVVITFDPTTRYLGDYYLNHPDHRAAGDAALDAVFPSARDRLTFPELLVDGLEPHKVREVWLGAADAANTWVDIGPTMALKKEALLRHPSQFDQQSATFIEELARMSGASQGIAFAESFRRIRIDARPETE